MKTNKLKNGLIGLMALGASSIAQAETINLNGSVVDFHRNDAGNCLD